MNRLDPGLQRLLRWAGRAPESPPAESPHGFSGRVVAQWRSARRVGSPPPVEGLLVAVAVASAVVILGGTLFLLSQSRAPEPATDLSSAAHFFVSNLTP